MYNPTSDPGIWHTCMAPLLTEVLAAMGKFIYWGLFTGAVIVLGVFFWWRERGLRKKMQAHASAQRSRATLELHTFQSQMDPHFIFNSLNAIHNRILSASTEQASDYLTRFSRLMRLVLENSSKEWVSLQEELEALELYLQLEQLRFEKFDYTVTCLPGSDTHSLVPPFIVQPYVQSAIWYRLLQRPPGGRGRLSVEVGRKEGGLYIRLEDNGVARQSAFSTFQQKTAGTRVAAERLHWLNARYHTHAAVTSGHLYDSHHQKTGTYTIIHLPDVNPASKPEETVFFQ
ncbi:histidine kinase [Chitinophaga lutea]|uniref:Histidine kinase n=2 Tax=Chitinophaga lutea TaxID=2488634 RepID=A0A3N4QPE7_9BACT|nr:histidine kinase [Chitinophaga lutea]